MSYPAATVSLTATGVVSLGSNEQDVAGRVVLQVVGNSWVGSAVPKIRVAGGNVIDANLKTIGYSNFATGAAIAAGTAITADGIYIIPSDAVEVVLDYTHTSGSAVVTSNFVAGTESSSSGGGGGGGVVTNAGIFATQNTNQAGEAHIGQVGGESTTPSANFTRPADITPYASGDLVANSTTAASVVPLTWTAARVAAGSFMIRRARLRKSSTSTTLASFRLHLYAADPSASTGITNGDNGAWLTKVSSYVGTFDLDISSSTGRVFSDASGVSGVPATGSELNVKLASGQSLYGLLEARAAYVPVSAEVFTVELELLQN